MPQSPFPKPRAGYPFPDLEAEVLDYWRREKIFERSLEANPDGPEFVFYEGPPTANNVPHVGHVVTRVIKDLFPRYRTMRGYRVARKAGWDTHGLPVEIEVEKALGFSGKEQIEAFGIAEFNQRCLESVHTYERQWRSMSERVGYWIDFDDAYLTYSNRYIESVWWALKRLWEKDLLYEGYKIQPYCARCGTTLSSHEVAQNYQETEDPSIWVLFPVRPGQTVKTVEGDTWRTPEGLAMVAWTTTPWTVLANVALTVNPGLTYKVVEYPGRAGQYLLFADALAQPVPLDIEQDAEKHRLDLRQLTPVVTISGRHLIDLRYERPFRLSLSQWGAGPLKNDDQAEPLVDDNKGFLVKRGDFATAAEGTGIVHIASYGEDDDRVIREQLLDHRIFSVGDDGRIVDQEETRSAGLAGRWFKDADPDIVHELKRRGHLLHVERYRHNYPFCWRCDRPLLYYPARSWFIRTTALQERLIAANHEISWHPEHVGEGRFGRWLEGGVDWALSRKRYWGTPLPVWHCSNCPADPIVVGSFTELFERAGRHLPENVYDPKQFDPHRPYVDTPELDTPGGMGEDLDAIQARRFAWRCEECGGIVARVDDVIDAWFDSGAMPFAQHHYLGKSLDNFDPENRVGFPADFISEAVDQTRGWFYTLHALGVLLFDSVAYRNCVVLGHVNDETGRKMSKRLGNVVEPMQVIGETGADAIRWYFCVNNPTVNSRFSERLVREAAQKFLLPLWNAVSFFSIYANLDGWHPDADGQFETSTLDRWIVSRLHRLLAETTDHLDSYRIAEAARGIETFVDELTNWYIRRSRNRFWAATDGDGTRAGKDAAYQTLYEVLTTLTRLIAPFTPFVAEVLHRDLVRTQSDDAPASVHLEGWPEADADTRDDQLERAIGDVQRIVRLGHAARNSHGLKTRQPLRSVTVIPADREMQARVTDHLDLLRDELNVGEVAWAEDRKRFVRHQVRPVFPKLGPRLGKDMPLLKKALENADGDGLAEELEREGRVTVMVAGEPIELADDEVEVVLNERAGTATEGDRELLVALDTELDQGLIDAGRAREVVHRLQTLRKELDLEYADRIAVAYSADPELERAIEAHRDWIAGETLTVEWSGDPSPGASEDPVDGLAFRFGITVVRQTQVSGG